ncbi:hypothetical protein [Terribacillus saccharophilus]|uniref:hypothetical protein n=1 Tax=Terribacillus saccharophilus TaxID=361277 RepID=UPI0015CF6FC1|nr:hypothetical protein [Terribacillus saccharophilus]
MLDFFFGQSNHLKTCLPPPPVSLYYLSKDSSNNIISIIRLFLSKNYKLSLYKQIVKPLTILVRQVYSRRMMNVVLKMKCISILHAFKKGDPGGASILYSRHFLVTSN